MLQIAACAALLLGTVAGAEAAARPGALRPFASTIFLFGSAAFHFVTVGVGSLRATSLGGDARVLALTVATWIAYFAFPIYLRRYFVITATS